MRKLLSALAAMLLACSPAGAGGITYPAANSFAPPVVSANIYLPLNYLGYSAAPANPGANTVACYNGALLRPTTIANLGAKINTLHAANNFQAAIYSSGSWGRPATLLAATGNISTAATGSIFGAISGGNVSLAAGTYWWCSNTGSGTVVFTSWGNSNTGGPVFIGASTGGNVLNTPINGISTSQTFGTWPAFTSGTSWTEAVTGVIPMVVYQVP